MPFFRGGSKVTVILCLFLGVVTVNSPPRSATESGASARQVVGSLGNRIGHWSSRRVGSSGRVVGQVVGSGRRAKGPRVRSVRSEYTTLHMPMLKQWHVSYASHAAASDS